MARSIWSKHNSWTVRLWSSIWWRLRWPVRLIGLRTIRRSIVRSNQWSSLQVGKNLQAVQDQQRAQRQTIIARPNRAQHWQKRFELLKKKPKHQQQQHKVEAINKKHLNWFSSNEIQANKKKFSHIYSFNSNKNFHFFLKLIYYYYCFPFFFLFLLLLHLLCSFYFKHFSLFKTKSNQKTNKQTKLT